MAQRARAPKPKATDEEEAKTSAKVATIVLKKPNKAKHPDGEPIERSLNIGKVAFRERSVVRKATGIPWEAFIGDEEGTHIGLDTLQIWWWLASRANGQPFCTLDQALADWPDEIDGETFDITIDTGDDDA